MVASKFFSQYFFISIINISGLSFEIVIMISDIIDFTKPKTLTKPGSSFIKNIHLINSPLKKSCCEDSSNSSG